VSPNVGFYCIADVMHVDNDPEAVALRLGYVSSGIYLGPAVLLVDTKFIFRSFYVLAIRHERLPWTCSD
jgi:hypothetical protein